MGKLFHPETFFIKLPNPKTYIPVTISLFLFYFFLNVSGQIPDVKQGDEKKLHRAPKGSFSIVVMSDTQEYLGHGTALQPDSQDDVTNPVFESQVNWIGKNIKSQNIVFVTHAGDIVDKNNHDQWEKARQYMDRLLRVIPYGMTAGNHDMSADGNSSLFQEYFPASLFRNFSWYGGFYHGDHLSPEISGNNANSYQLFSASGIDFIILHLECNAPDNVLQWADSILYKHENCFAIITTHMYLGPKEKPVTLNDYYYEPKGRMLWIKCHGQRGNTAQQMWEKCFAKHRNLHLIFSGDQSRSNAMHIRSIGNNGNAVYAFLNDYRLSGGAVRIYRFLPEDDEILVMTYNTVKKRLIFETPEVQRRDEHFFRISLSM